MQQLSNSLLNSVNSNNNNENNNNVESDGDVEDESRFEVPTDETKMQMAAVAEQSSGQDGVITLNSNSNLNNISENDLEARLR